MTPLGVYNVQVVPASREHPTGQIITPIDPDNFEVAVLSNHPRSTHRSKKFPKMHYVDYVKAELPMEVETKEYKTITLATE